MRNKDSQLIWESYITEGPDKHSRMPGGGSGITPPAPRAEGGRLHRPRQETGTEALRKAIRGRASDPGGWLKPHPGMETIYKGVDADGRKVYELKFPEGFGLVHPDASDQPTPNPDEQQLRDYMNSYPEFYRLMHGDKNKSQ